MSEQPVIKGWKQQMMTVTKIGDEKPLTRPPWKRYKEIDPSVGQKTQDTSDQSQ